MKPLVTVVLLIAALLIAAACGDGGESSATPPPSTAEVLHFSGYDVTREGLAAYIYDALFAGEDPDALRVLCGLARQPNYEASQSGVPVDLWEIEEEDAPGALEKYHVKLIPGQKADPAHANIPHEILLDECERIGG